MKLRSRLIVKLAICSLVGILSGCAISKASEGEPHSSCAVATGANDSSDNLDRGAGARTLGRATERAEKTKETLEEHAQRNAQSNSRAQLRTPDNCK